jgi:hypothetical protein
MVGDSTLANIKMLGLIAASLAIFMLGYGFSLMHQGGMLMPGLVFVFEFVFCLLSFVFVFCLLSLVFSL